MLAQGGGGPSTVVTVRAAVVQAAAVAFDRDRTIERVDEFTRKAAADGAQLVVFPEAFVSGYPKLASFGTVVGERSPEGREWFRRYHESSIEIPSPALDRLGAIARSNRVHLVIGVIERSAGTLYCTVLFIGPAGDLLGKHRKLVPTAMERLIWGYGDGSTITVLPTPLGKDRRGDLLGKLHAQLRLAMYSKGIEIYCSPTVDARETWLAYDAAYRFRGPLLRPVGLPVYPQVRLPSRLSDRHSAIRMRS